MGEHLRDELGACFLAEARVRIEESAALIRHCVEQLDDEKVWWRPDEGMNSIGNLLLHLTGNLTQRVRSEVAGEPDSRDRFGEFMERRSLPRRELLDDFQHAVDFALEWLDSAEPDRLLDRRQTQRLAGRVEKPGLAILFQTIAHLAGHAQEIVFITRLQLKDRYAFRSPSGVPPQMRRTV